MKRISLGLLLLLLLTLPPWSLQGADGTPNPTTAASSEKRFLFIVDVSESMEKLEHGGRQALFNLIYGGMDGYMRGGDSFGLWLVNDKLNTAYPMQVWQEKDALNLASKASIFVRESAYARRSRMKPALEAARSIIERIQDVNLVFISDHHARMEGTPFDDLINEIYGKRAAEVEAKQQPILTTLVAEQGKIVQSLVTMPGEPIGLPVRPDPVPDPAPSRQAKVTDKAAPAPVSPAPDAKPLPKVSSLRSIVISGKSNPAAENGSQVSVQVEAADGSISVVEPAANAWYDRIPLASNQPTASASLAVGPSLPTTPNPGQPRTTPSPAPAPSSTGTIPTGAPAETAVVGTVSVAPPAPAPAAVVSQDRSPVAATLAALSPAPTPVLARESGVEPAAPAQAPAPLNPSPVVAWTGSLPMSSPSSWLWWMGGAACLLLALVLGWVFVRLHRSTHRPSAITQSMARR